MLKKISDHLPQALLLIFCLWSVKATYELLRGGLGWSDFYGQWTLCAYTLHGIDPYPQTGIEPPLLPDVGSIPAGWGTSPWGLVLGNLFYPGWFSYNAAAMQFFLLNIIMIALTAYLLFDRLKNVPRPTAFLIALSLMSAPNFWRALHQGNCGGMIGCLLIIACLICDRRPIMAGATLAFAMVKPQLALLICFAFLLQKKYRPLLAAAVIDLIAWLGAALLVDRTPIELLQEFLSSNIGANAFKGILTLAGGLLPSPSWVMPLSMMIGTAFVFFVQRLIGDATEDLPLKIFMPASVAATFWSYSWDNDRFILFVATLMALLLMLESRNIVEQLVMFSTATVCQLCLPLMFRCNARLSEWLEVDAWHHTVTAFEMIFIMIAVFLAFRLKRKKFF